MSMFEVKKKKQQEEALKKEQERQRQENSEKAYQEFKQEKIAEPKNSLPETELKEIVEKVSQEIGLTRK